VFLVGSASANKFWQSTGINPDIRVRDLSRRRSQVKKRD
jgi:hypothetical protein